MDLTLQTNGGIILIMKLRRENNQLIHLINHGINISMMCDMRESVTLQVGEQVEEIWNLILEELREKIGNTIKAGINAQMRKI